MTQTLDVEVGADHIANFVKTPRAGLAELVWNALDAAATRVDIGVEVNALEGVDVVSVTDNGVGMTAMEAVRGFKNFGESWKRSTARNAADRPFHGKHGRGRYTAFALGENVTWETVSHDEGQSAKVLIEGERGNLKQFRVSEPVPTTAEAGTTVTARLLSEKAQQYLIKPDVRVNLTTALALFLEQYPDVRVTYRGASVTPAGIQGRTETLAVNVDGIDVASLRVIEWEVKVDRRLYLCDAEGSALDDVSVGTQPGVSFHYTAYLRWQGFADMRHDILLADSAASEAAPVITEARRTLKRYLQGRLQEREREVLGDWGNAGIYPYVGEPSTDTERAERQAFDVVAVSAAPVINDAPERSRRLMLNLIKTALESSPGSLQQVLTEVLDLPPERIEELKTLLDKTSLASIIESSKRITGRLDFLHGLNAILFDTDTRRTLLERRQLHRILAHETWVFGEEWALTGDDDRLTQVLKKHLGRLGEEVEGIEDEPVKREDGSDGIPDLVLSRTLSASEDRYRHLVVELKRPNWRLKPEDVQQLQSYAGAITRDERFDQPNAQWDFWLVGNSVTDDVDEQRVQVDKPFGLVTQNRRYSLWVKTWAEVLGSAEHRLKFVRDSLDYSTNRDRGIGYLRETHAQYLPDALRSDESGPKDVHHKDDVTGT